MFSNSFNGLVSGSVQSLSYDLAQTTNISVAVAVGQMTAAECDKQGVAAGSLAYVHKIINYRDMDQNLTVSLTGLPSGAQLKPSLDVSVLATSGNSNRDQNSFREPTLVAPVQTTLAVSGPSFTVTLPKWSVVVARAYVSSSAQQPRSEKKALYA